MAGSRPSSRCRHRGCSRVGQPVLQVTGHRGQDAGGAAWERGRFLGHLGRSPDSGVHFARAAASPQTLQIMEMTGRPPPLPSAPGTPPTLLSPTPQATGSPGRCTEGTTLGAQTHSTARRTSTRSRACLRSPPTPSRWRPSPPWAPAWPPRPPFRRACPQVSESTAPAPPSPWSPDARRAPAFEGGQGPAGRWGKWRVTRCGLFPSVPPLFCGGWGNG